MKKHFFRINYPSLIILLLLAGLCNSCKRSNLLNEKPGTNLVIPSTVQDFQAILDGTNDMNITPGIGEVSADNYYLNPEHLFVQSTTEQNAYIWAPEIFSGVSTADYWNIPYKQIFNANVVLEGIDKTTDGSAQEKNTVKGSALFYRAHAFYNLAQLFAPVYDSATSATDPGIPLRLTPDITQRTVRSSVKQTYDQILEDLNMASSLLPDSIPFANRNRPSKPAAEALLARVYLSMRAYNKAGIAADNSLKLYNKLINYNTVSLTATLPFKNNNIETLFQSTFEGTSLILAASVGRGNVDPLLYGSYEENDLRKSIFFRITGGLARVKGGYGGSVFTFSGLAVDEVYLIRAECYAREEKPVQAMNDLNTLLEQRYSGTYVPVTATDAADALNKVLTERRKELLVRGTRWTDLRRLNKEGYNIEPKRIVNNQTYVLPPNSPLYVLPIPPDVVALSGIQQNKR